MYRAAVIGLGRMGSTFDDEIQQGGTIFLPYCHAPSYAASPHTELVAGADLHAEQGVIFAKRWGLSTHHIYSDYRDMLAAEQPDFVSVCTTARHRAAIMKDAIEAGVKAIWAEKPVTLSLAEADDVIDLGARNGVAIAVNCSRRYSPFLSEARRMAQQGELGELLQITAYTECYISHNGSHAIDTMRYLVDGDVDWVFGEMESDEEAAGEEDLRGNGYLAFDNGVRGYIRAMPTGAAPWEFDLIGTEGRVRSLANGTDTQYYRWVPGGLRDEGLPARAPFPLPLSIQGTGLSVIADLVNAVETGSDPHCSAEDGRKALEIAVALRESHRQGGRRIDLPVADRSLRILSVEIGGDAVPARVRRQRQEPVVA